MNDIIYVGKHALTYSVTKHLHKNWELIYCTSGSGELVFSGKSFVYKEDTVAIIPPMCPHINKSDGGFTNIHTLISDAALNVAEPVVISGLNNDITNLTTMLRSEQGNAADDRALHAYQLLVEISNQRVVLRTVGSQAITLQYQAVIG